MPLAQHLRSLIAIFFIALVHLGATAQAVLPVPALSARVIDQTGTLDAAQKKALEAKLASLEKTKGSQVVVLMVPTTAPEDIASYTQRVGDTWKIGRKDVGDGLLLVVAKDDRKMRIAPAKTLEGAVPDVLAARIIDETMKPLFRAGDFAGGIGGAVDQVTGLINGEALPRRSGKTAAAVVRVPPRSTMPATQVWAGRTWPSSCSSPSSLAAPSCAPSWATNSVPW